MNNEINKFDPTLPEQTASQEAQKTNTTPRLGNVAKSLVELATPFDEHEIARRLEVDGYVKVAPRLAEQVQDESRMNRITFIPQSGAYLVGAERKDVRSIACVELSESESLQQLYDFLDKVDADGGQYANVARDMKENLTFIGEKEFDEAAKGIADEWKASLDEDEALTICPVMGMVDERRVAISKETPATKIKSDEYLLNAVLSNFSEEDWRAYGSKIILDVQSPRVNADHTRVMLLDDWVLSGEQMQSAYANVVAVRPDLKNAIEMQLITADKALIQEGFYAMIGDEPEDFAIPVTAYYLSHTASTSEETVVYNTGGHSSTDYVLDGLVGLMAMDLWEKGYKDIMLPPLTNIVRPYQKEDFTRSDLVHYVRLQELQSAGSSGIMNE